MKTILSVLLALSVVFNLWLFKRSAAPAGSPAARAVTADGTSAGTSAPAASAATAAKSTSAKAAPADPAHVSALLKALAEMDENDLPGAVARLRALGASESTIYAAVGGTIRLAYYRGIRVAEVENIQNGWWKGNPGDGPNKPGWGKTAESKFVPLLGYDPYDIIDYGSKFSFLPKEKADALARIAVDYYGLYLAAAEGPQASNSAYEMTIAERRKDVEKLLTPEELAEYDLRFSDTAAQNTKRFAKMQATEQEFRAISPIMDRAQQETTALSRDTTTPAAQRATAQRAATQRAFDDLVSTVGYDRAVEYAWSGTQIAVQPDNPSVSSLAILSNTPPKVMQLASETGEQAAAIHADPNLSPDAKKAALLALQQSVQPKLDQVLPADARENLDPQALQWFNVLAKGQYMMMSPSLSGTSISIVGSTSVTTPAPTARVAPPQIRKLK